MTLNFHKKPQRDSVFHFFLKFLLFLIYFILFALYFFFQHADVHATACWRIGSYAPGLYLTLCRFCSFMHIVESGVKHHQTNKLYMMHFYALPN